MLNSRGLSLVEDNCILCEICVRICRHDALIGNSGDKGYSIIYIPQNCPDECNDCVEKCPARALSRETTNKQKWIIPYPICSNCGKRGLPFIHFNNGNREDKNVYSALCVDCRRKLNIEKINEAIPEGKPLKLFFSTD